MSIFRDRRFQLALGALAIALIAFYVFGTPTTVAGRKDVIGDFNVRSGDTVIMKDNGEVRATGDIEIKGEVECAGGSALFVAGGKLTVSGTLSCLREPGASDLGKGIVLVAKNGIEFTKDATVITNGHIEIVSDESKLLGSQEAISAAFMETAENSGGGVRLGPFMEKAAINVDGLSSISVPTAPVGHAQAESILPFVRVADAQVPRDKGGNALPNLILRGTWHIGDSAALPSGVDVPTPPKGVNKILLHFDLGSDGDASLEDFHLIGPAGRDGKESIGSSCDAHGEKGEDAFRMRLNARNIYLNEFRLELGNGGAGGAAETMKECEPGIAKGGDGGEAGNFKMTASEGIRIKNFHIVPGKGGQGGSAVAYGKDGTLACPGGKGGDGAATGGNGGKNKKELAALGAVDGIDTVTIDRVTGGAGGDATAVPGKGGAGDGCNCAGGRGGNGNATGGKGGDASVAVPGITAEAHGGDGGDADTHGGEGGLGGSCPNAPAGGNGGGGGGASAGKGEGGSGTTAPGADGFKKDETGGNGGNGGDGCGPGKGGPGGLGAPVGVRGQDGKLSCVEQEKKTETTVPGDGAGSQKMIKAIEYRGKYLPQDQLIIENEAGCGADHWHAAMGIVKATDGSMVPDPGPQCGYGKTSEKPLMSVPAESN